MHGSKQKSRPFEEALLFLSRQNVAWCGRTGLLQSCPDLYLNKFFAWVLQLPPESLEMVSDYLYLTTSLALTAYIEEL